jgi:UPF0755 protein
VTDIFDLGLEPHPPKPPLYRRLLQIPAIGVSLALVVALVAGGVLLAGKVFHPTEANDWVGDGSGTVLVEVHPGDSLTDIGRTLVADGVVKSVTAFVDAAQVNEQAQNIQPGVYKLRLHMSAQAALGLLLDPTSFVGARVTIPEGMRLSKTLQIIASHSRISVAELQAALAKPDALGLPAYAHGQAEGFLYPATYNIDESTTATSLLSEMVATFRQVAASIDLDGGAQQLGLTPYQVVIIASLIEAEVKRPQDYPLVAEVILNRLHRGMPLQLDSTVNYALGTSKFLLSQSDLKTESPYNTYLHTGLPPTPIDSPDKAALLAALHPAHGDYLYFVTTDPVTGETTFTASQKEFEKLRAQVQASYAASATAPTP